MKFVRIVSSIVAISFFTVACGSSGGSSSSGSSRNVTLRWDAPTTNIDGAPLTDLAGYIVHYGTVSGNYPNSVNVGNVTEFSRNLTAGIWCFAITCFNTSGNESDLSYEVCIDIKQ
jgi:hypothetical protein